MPKILWNSFVGAAFGVSICTLSASADITTPEVLMGEQGSVKSTEFPVSVSPLTKSKSLDLQELSMPDSLTVSSTELEITNPEIETPVAPAAPSEVFSPEVTPDNVPSVDSLYLSEEEPSNEAMEQVTSVSQLSDVQPTDWAYEALRSLVERYGCIAGYPDGTFRGNRAMTRYEFAAGLNACMNQIERLIAANTANFVTKEDLATLQRLVDEFRSEIGALRGRVDTLEARTTQLETQQFSTTTKLSGEAIFAITDVLSGDSNPFNVGITRNTTVFANRVRLNLLTSFTGNDVLHTRLESGNFPHPQRPGAFRYGADPILENLGILGSTPEGGQTFNIGATEPAGSVALGLLSYKFSVGQNLRVAIFGNLGEHPDYLPTTFSTWADDDGGTGSLSTFAQYSPIYRIGVGAGAGLNYSFSPSVSLSLGYLAAEANIPESLSAANIRGGGLFNGRYGALAQLTFQPNDNVALGLTYNHSYSAGLPLFFNDVGTTSANVNITLTSPSLRYSADSFGVAGMWRVTPGFAVNGWFVYTNVKGKPPAGEEGGSADVFSYAVSLAFPDLGGRGNLGGIVVGVPPYATRIGIAPSLQDLFGTNDAVKLIPNRAIPFHIEAFYKYQLTDNISITPGVIWLTAPNQTTTNSDVVIGTLRTTFTF
ncbi:MAG TPA: porin [Cyanobacteria bacterium UBA11162]|nr:porin [Cyanobacteria bacterium UBA11162]